MDKYVFICLLLCACNEARPDQWGLRYAREYEQWSSAGKDEPPRERSDDDPRFPRLYAGSAFAKSYRHARAHTHSLEDVTSTPRLTEHTTAACLTCKTASYRKLLDDEAGDPASAEQQLGSRRLSEVAPAAQGAIGCVDCHDPQGIERGEPLRVSRPALLRALPAAQDATQEGLHTFVCAQCHSEYYVATDTQVIEHPWTRGLRIDDIIAYYDAIDFSDFVHPLSGAPLLKINHPDFELFYQSKHAESHVSCAHCHMPPDGSGTSHAMKSPLASAACQQCHKNKDAQAEVAAMRSGIDERLTRIIGKLDSGHALVGEWLTNEAESDRVKSGQVTLRRAQARWDFIASEGSRGVHAPEEAARVLTDAEALLDALLGGAP